jgi:hypothetical protein
MILCAVVVTGNMFIKLVVHVHFLRLILFIFCCTVGVPEHFLVKVLSPIGLINDDFSPSSVVWPEILILLQESRAHICKRF